MAAKRSIGGGAAGLGEVLRTNNYQERNIDDYIPSAPTMTTEDAVLAWYVIIARTLYLIYPSPTKASFPCLA